MLIIQHYKNCVSKSERLAEVLYSGLQLKILLVSNYD